MEGEPVQPKMEERLRAKPFAVRKMIQIGIALGITVVLVLVTLTIGIFKNSSTATLAEGNKSDSPFSIIGDNFSGLFESTANTMSTN